MPWEHLAEWGVGAFMFIFHMDRCITSTTWTGVLLLSVITTIKLFNFRSETHFFLFQCQQTLIVSLHNRTAERRGQQNACVWQMWQGYYLHVLSWSYGNLCFLIFLKEDEVWGNFFSNKIIIVTLETQGLTIFFALPACWVSSWLWESIQVILL